MTEPVSDETQAKHRGIENLIPWVPGQSGNPAGRPKSARSKLQEGFLKAFADDFATNGVAVIESVRADKPADYLKIAASLLPKQIEGSEDPDAPPIKTSLTVKFE